MEFLWHLDNVYLRDIVLSFVFLGAILAMRTLLARAVVHSGPMSLDVRRRWLVNIRNGTLFILLIGLLFIWAHELQTLAVSLVAIAAALVLAAKEFILCVSGGLWRATSKAYSVGDHIEVGQFRGDVIDITMLSTTVMELGPGQHSHQYTGRAVVFPNSLLLSMPLISDNYTGEFGVHVIRVPLDVDEDWQKAEQLLLHIANEECGAFFDDAKKHMESVERQHGYDTPSVSPRATFEFVEPKKIAILVRIPVPSGRKGRIEQRILHRFLEAFYGKTKGVSAVSAVDAEHAPSATDLG